MRDRLDAAKRIARRVAYTVTAVVVSLWMLNLWIEYRLSLAIVDGGMAPGFAAKDLDAFDAVSHPTESSPGMSELKAQGRILTIGEGARVRVMERYNLSCQGHEFGATRVKLLDGMRNGQTVWMCTDEFVMASKMF